MLNSDDVKKLAALARITVEDAELLKFTSEFEAILAYVGQLEEVHIDVRSDEKPAVRNILREDGEPRAPGAYTKEIVAQFPAKKGNALAVKQIIQHD